MIQNTALLYAMTGKVLYAVVQGLSLFLILMFFLVLVFLGLLRRGVRVFFKLIKGRKTLAMVPDGTIPPVAIMQKDNEVAPVTRQKVLYISWKQEEVESSV